MSMSSPSIHGLTNAVDAVRRERHDTGDLLDLQLLARPAQTFSQHTDRRHHGTNRAATTGAHTAGTTPPTTLATAPATRTAARAALPGGRGIQLGLDQSLWIIAVRFVQFPASAEIHAGGRRLRKLFARTRCETHHRHNHDEPHPAIL
jgi:hypothetical protein